MYIEGCAEGTVNSFSIVDRFSPRIVVRGDAADVVS